MKVEKLLTIPMYLLFHGIPYGNFLLNTVS